MNKPKGWLSVTKRGMPTFFDQNKPMKKDFKIIRIKFRQEEAVDAGLDALEQALADGYSILRVDSAVDNLVYILLKEK